MNTKQIEENFWASKSREFVEKEYWNWPGGNKRSKWFSKKIRGLKFKSIYEVGVFGGRNFKGIIDQYPDITIGGLDINKAGVEFAKEKFPNGQFDCMSAFDVDKVSGDWDLIFTMGTVIHMAPEFLDDFILKLTQKAKRYIVHVEQNGQDQIINGPKKLKPTGKVMDKLRWMPNIMQRYKNLGYKPFIESLPVEVRGSDCVHYILIDLNAHI